MKNEKSKFLVPQCLSALAPSKKSAFTLAEVLITLAIIGVVAAMTIPTLISNYKEKATVTKLKKAYSILNQAYTLAKIDYGTVDQWGLINPEYTEDGDWTPEFYNNFTLFWDIMSKYMRVAGRCNLTDESCSDLFVKNFEIKTLDGSSKAINQNGIEMGILLQDGILLTGGYISSGDCSRNIGNGALSNVCGDFSVKLGAKEKLYENGKNSFYFYITKNGIYPIGSNGDTNLSFETACSVENYSSNNGYGCTAWIIQNGNMDYLHCNDLSWNGKRKCSD